ncbi:MAG: hypothetical protein JXA74_07645 [Anaerolineae bacterium]|nr:hypothetical protein [Anaerolineae bacterium]
MRAPQVRTLALATASYLTLTLVLTWPVAAQFGSAVAGFEALDGLQYTWSLWWSGRAWRSGQGVSDVSLLYHPWGGFHPLLGVTPLLDWLAFPLQWLFSPTQVYNALFLGSFVLCGLAMYLLAQRITGHAGAAFVAGAVYAFFPNRMGHALSGHLTQLASWWVPLAVWAGMGLLREPTVLRALATGLLAALACLVALVQTAYFAAPVFGILFACVLLDERRSAHQKRMLLLAGLIAAAAVAPMYVPFAVRAQALGMDLSAPGTEAYSVDPLTWVIPSPYHPLWGRAVAAIEPIRLAFSEANELEHMAFLGWIPLVLAAMGLGSHRWRQTLPWLALMVSGLWLSVGPSLRLAGVDTGIFQPYAILQRLPFFRWGRTPERFVQMATFGLATLASQGLARWPRPRAAQAALVALLLLESVILWPFPQGTPQPPQMVASWPDGAGAVLSLPSKKRQIGNLAMYYQTAHGRPIVGGYIHRELEGMNDYKKAVDAVLIGAPMSDSPDPAAGEVSPAEVLGLLQGLDIEYILVHRQFVRQAEVTATVQRLAAALDRPVGDTGPEVVFWVPSAQPEVGALGAFDIGVDLVAVQVEPERVAPGQPFTITCRWRARARPDGPYTIFVHVLDQDGERVAQADAQPLDGWWPFDLWAPGESVVDERTLQLGHEIPPGAFDLGIGLYGQRATRRVGVSGLHVREGMVIVHEALEMIESAAGVAPS